MTDRALMVRAAIRVVARVLAKSGAYIGVGLAALAVYRWHQIEATSNPAVAHIVFTIAICGWATLALWVFRIKLREEAQRIGGGR